MLDKLQHTDFAPLLGQVFSMDLGGGRALELTLLEVTPVGGSRTGARQAFSLTFRSALPGHAPQAIYRLRNDALGALDVFLVPIGPRDGGMCYEAIFN